MRAYPEPHARLPARLPPGARQRNEPAALQRAGWNGYGAEPRHGEGATLGADEGASRRRSTGLDPESNWKGATADEGDRVAASGAPQLAAGDGFAFVEPIGDLDGDGVLDFATADEHSDAIFVLLGSQGAWLTASEIAAGTLTLTLTSTGNGTCLPVTSDRVITCSPATRPRSSSATVSAPPAFTLSSVIDVSEPVTFAAGCAP